MTIRDVIDIGLGNMWRMKLRTSLTLLGVVIAIGAFVSMLSLGAGMQKNVSEQFDKLGLLFTIQVSQKHQEEGGDTTKSPSLNDSVLTKMMNLPGVQLVYPFEDYQVTVSFDDTVFNTKAQALAVNALETKLFSTMQAGIPFDSDSAKQAVVTDEFIDSLKITEPDSAIGQKLIISVKVATIDSALIHIFMKDGKFLWDRLKGIRFDSLFYREYRSRVVRREFGDAVGRFIDGYLNARTTVSDTLTIVGVLNETRQRFRVQPIILPLATGERFSAAGFSGDMTDLIGALSSGQLFQSSASPTSKSYSRVTIDLKRGYSHKPVVDSIRAMGFRAFSYAEDFEEITKFFTYFDLGLGVIGLIALFVSSLGIVNTMMMSITERRREIGVLKSLGAYEREIKLMFLVESALIGSIGSVFGILLGWGISRVASAVSKIIMIKQGVDPIEVFALPWWLIAVALLLGLTVSLIAGYYPSSRAARLDPVESLRYE